MESKIYGLKMQILRFLQKFLLSDVSCKFTGQELL